MKTAGEDVDFVVGHRHQCKYPARISFQWKAHDIVMSLSSETGREINRNDLLIDLYENFTKWYKKLLQNGFAAIKERWLDLAPDDRTGCSDNVSKRKNSGKALDLADDGSLIVLTTPGNEKLKISAGDATVLNKGLQSFVPPKV